MSSSFSLRRVGAYISEYVSQHTFSQSVVSSLNLTKEGQKASRVLSQTSSDDFHKSKLEDNFVELLRVANAWKR